MRAPNSNPIQRYQNLRLKESLCRPDRYSLACKELSLFLRSAYSICPKNLQSQIFQDTLFAFSLLPELFWIPVQSAISAANSLLQSAEFALPKQRRGLAVKEHKHAMVACKRKSKSLKEEEEEEVPTELPWDVLVHIFGFLDLQSLVSAAAVCRLWNAVASDNHLWKSLHATFFGKLDNSFKLNGNNTDGTIKSEKDVHSANHAETKADTDWRNAFKRAYREICSRKFKYHRGCCSSCGSIVWLNSNKCSNTSGIMDISTHQINPLSTRQIVEYILGGSFSSESSSDDDSDSDRDDNSFCKLWAYEYPSPEIRNSIWNLVRRPKTHWDN